MTRIAAPAKLNLFLEVLAREESGYHQLETLFCALELADELDVELTPARGIELLVEVAELGPAEDNLVHRAARLFLAEARLPGGARIVLRKRIPAGAGLGGGSSDAAATLLALDREAGQVLGPERRLELGARLGSDVPFFLSDSAFALAWGRGERLLPLPALPAAPVLLAVPTEKVSTAEAFAALAARRARAAGAGAGRATRPRLLSLEQFRSWEEVARRARNDFEPIVLERLPELAQVRAIMRRHGALHTLLTGSGSVYYAIFPDPQFLARAAAEIERAASGVRTIATATRTQPAARPD